MSNDCNLPKLYQFSRAFLFDFQSSRSRELARDIPSSLILHHLLGRIQTLGQVTMAVAGVIRPWHKGHWGSIGVICCEALWRNETLNI